MSLFAQLLSLLLLFASTANAQLRGDMISFNYTGLNLKGDTAWDLRTGAPPITMGKLRFLNSLYTRHVGLQTATGNFSLSEYAYSLGVATELGDGWTLLVRGQGAVRNATEQLTITNESLFLSFLAMGTHSMGESKTWKWSIGFVIPESAVKIPVIPLVGFAYDSPDHDWFIQLGFPMVVVTYVPDPDWRIGISTYFESGAYLLQAGSPYRTGNVKYLGQSRISLTPFARYQLLKQLAISARAGYSFKSKSAFENDRYEDQQVIDEKPGWLAQIGLAFNF